MRPLPTSDAKTMVSVELRGARIPWIGWFAHHYWLVVHEPEASRRWEVWQRPQALAVCNGHLHCDLLPWRAGVGAGNSWLVQQWVGNQAVELAERIRASLTEYPWCDRYRYWPGPNSNTYVQWLLGARLRLPWQAIGRGYRGLR